MVSFRCIFPRNTKQEFLLLGKNAVEKILQLYCWTPVKLGKKIKTLKL